jgi:hypothetical protein
MFRKSFLISLILLPAFVFAADAQVVQRSLVANIYCATFGSWFNDATCTPPIEPSNSTPPSTTALPLSKTHINSSPATSTIIQNITQPITYITQPTVIERIIQQVVQPSSWHGICHKRFSVAPDRFCI